MNVKILKLLSIVCVALLFSACSNKELVYVDRQVEVKVPVKCNVPKTHCDFKQLTYWKINDYGFALSVRIQTVFLPKAEIPT
jgi:hypothetical protein